MQGKHRGVVCELCCADVLPLSCNLMYCHRSSFFTTHLPPPDGPALPHTPTALSRTQSLSGTGKLRTSLFGLQPTTYEDIQIDSTTNRVVGKDGSLPLNGKWFAKRALYDPYPLHTS